MQMSKLEYKLVRRFIRQRRLVSEEGDEKRNKHTGQHQVSRAHDTSTLKSKSCVGYMSRLGYAACAGTGPSGLSRLRGSS